MSNPFLIASIIGLIWISSSAFGGESEGMKVCQINSSKQTCCHVLKEC